MTPLKSVKRRKRAQIGLEAVHLYSVIALKGGEPDKEQVEGEMATVVKTGVSCWASQ